mmetsp:Transcript_4564/g.10747  ORF Transcript_4564/g.10747 Transcript_4564/m.10747 type:complete len:270 (+) Transcript_4564:220-1029(+)
MDQRRIEDHETTALWGHLHDLVPRPLRHRAVEAVVPRVEQRRTARRPRPAARSQVDPEATPVFFGVPIRPVRVDDCRKAAVVPPAGDLARNPGGRDPLEPIVRVGAVVPPRRVLGHHHVRGDRQRRLQSPRGERRGDRARGEAGALRLALIEVREGFTVVPGVPVQVGRDAAQQGQARAERPRLPQVALVVAVGLEAVEPADAVLAHVRPLASESQQPPLAQRPHAAPKRERALARGLLVRAGSLGGLHRHERAQRVIHNHEAGSAQLV